MAGERRRRILARLVGDRAAGLETKRLCRVCAEVTAVTGAGIMLMSGDVPRGSVCTTDAVSAVIEQLQYELGEGPCVDAYRHDRPVLEPGLAQPATPRWLAFTGPALARGVRAVFGFPLQVGAVRLGALNLYRDRPGPLDDEQHADALVMADVAAQAVLLLQADAPPGKVASELEAGADFHLRRAPGCGHGRRPARRDRRPSVDPAAGLRLRQRPSPRRGRPRRRSQKAPIRRRSGEQDAAP